MVRADRVTVVDAEDEVDGTKIALTQVPRRRRKLRRSSGSVRQQQNENELAMHEENARKVTTISSDFVNRSVV